VISEARSTTATGGSIRLFGPVRVDVDGQPIVVDTRKAIALLAYLAVIDRPATREELAALLWPESDETAARGALRRTLSVLNTGLAGRGLTVSRAAIALAGPWDVDLRRFRAALAEARRHAHPADEACGSCLAALEDAAAVGGGEFMAGFSLRDSEPFDEWQLGEAEAHRRDLAGVLERLARGRAAGGEWAAAIQASRLWLELDRLHEPAHRQLMLVLARAGEPAAAIAQYRECVRILDAELGVPPLDETTALYEAIRGGDIAPQPQPMVEVAGAGTRIDLPLVGRARDLEDLRSAWRAIGPDGRLLVIEGEPGIGKTRLAAVLAAEVGAAGGSVLQARAFAGEAAIPFGPVAALVREGLARPDARDRLAALPPELLADAALVVPAVAPTAPLQPPAALDALGRARAIEGLSEVLATLAGGPVGGLIVLDDLDWADASSVEVLGYLARRLHGRRLGLVVTWRPLDASDQERARLVRGAEREGLVVRVRLERLGRPDVAELARAALGQRANDAFVTALHDESEGLPLYIAEVLESPNAGIGRVPRGFIELLRGRIASVGDLAGQVLGAAAVVGRSFDFETVREASGRSEDETVAGLEELIRRGLVRESEAPDGVVGLDFSHGRLRDVAYESLGLVRRRLLHHRVAEALRAAPRTEDGDRARWARVAFHETQAGRHREAAHAHARAAEEARAVFANREAREHLEAALALGDPATAELHESLGQVLTLLGDYAGAISHLEASAADPPPGRAAAIERELALVHSRLADWPRAASHIGAALQLAPEGTSRAALLADQSAIAARLGDEAAAEAAAREALRLAETSGDAEGIARGSHVLAVLARGRGAFDEAIELLERSLAAADRAAEPDLRIASLNTLALVRAAAGDRVVARRLLEEALARCARRGDRHRQAALENNLADVLRADGQREAAMDHLKRAVAIFAEIGGRPGLPDADIWKLVEW
jgi:DNA-binding SARP family transcriptional activator/tetratricopeptide (TPR) repeat protein